MMLVVWQEGEQAVWVSIAILKQEVATIGHETLVAALCGLASWDDPQKDVIMHETVHWRCISRMAVNQETKTVTPVAVVRMDQCVPFFALPTMLKFEESCVSFGEKSVDDVLGV